MKAVISIIMGSTSDLPVMEKAAKILDELHSVYPVCNENLDEVIGVVLLKDF